MLHILKASQENIDSLSWVFTIVSMIFKDDSQVSNLMTLRLYSGHKQSSENELHFFSFICIYQNSLICKLLKINAAKYSIKSRNIL